jgi:heterotetrameric sarcosine oxidase gamma subunit
VIRRLTPLYHWHKDHGARFVDRQGWQLPAVYTTVEQELAAAQTGLALADVSAFAKISLLGQGVATLTAALLGDSPASRPLGVGTLSAGGPVCACRLTADHLLLLASTTDLGPLSERLKDLTQDQPIISTDVTSGLAGFWLGGPRVEEVLRRLTALDVCSQALPHGACAETMVAGVQALLVRPPARPIPAVGVYVSWDLGEYVWEQLLAAAGGWTLAGDGGWGLTPLGLEAWHSLWHGGGEQEA